ncbi:MAG: GvpL/GvpF family gas vesicle protein [Candidatus Schekmanbacteria bacterium]|nr:GvpL/GvpF family gas vesicle protein [Candidatus Schekmanbacteria bacterium]
MADPTGWYLYAITAPEATCDLRGLTPVASADGQAGDELRVVRAGAIAFITSAFHGREVRPQRANIAAHHAVLQALMQSSVAFLPVAFGVVAPSLSNLQALLAANEATIAEELDRLAGKVELTLKVSWDVPNIYEFFVFRNPELAELRDRLQNKWGPSSRDERIALGRTFESLLHDARERHRANVEAILENVALEIHEGPVKREEQVMNLTCLVERARATEFEQAVFAAAALFDDNYAFDYSGPFPPFHFVRVALGKS